MAFSRRMLFRSPPPTTLHRMKPSSHERPPPSANGYYLLCRSVSCWTRVHVYMPEAQLATHVRRVLAINEAFCGDTLPHQGDALRAARLCATRRQWFYVCCVRPWSIARRSTYILPMVSSVQPGMCDKTL
ncbi:hypothetical protein VTK73DRAFT_2850 [Phialemonium thermophilum]|uniref:Uncharacterized protein n=1 Tax=Phialemonium thermophilum TaxID=223376 RepID=A0ABR3VNF3_9PEZI